MKLNDVELLDPETGKMVCRKCEFAWFASIQHGGKFYPGSWTCQNCKGDFL